MDLLIPFTMIMIAYFSGRYIEKRHFRRLQIMERALAWMPATNTKVLTTSSRMESKGLVIGSVVIGEDYFKNFAAKLKNFFGGRLSAYESLLDRARREAIVRLKQNAKSAGANAVINVRLDTSTLSGPEERKRNALVCVEVIASGTAVKLS